MNIFIESFFIHANFRNETTEKKWARPWVRILAEIEREVQSSSIIRVSCINSVQLNLVLFFLAVFYKADSMPTGQNLMKWLEFGMLHFKLVAELACLPTIVREIDEDCQKNSSRYVMVSWKVFSRLNTFPWETYLTRWPNLWSEKPSRQTPQRDWRWTDFRPWHR